MRVRMLSLIFNLFIALLFCVMPVWAGTTGKIAGIVIDADKNEPLAGVNIYLKDNSMGAASDADGYYVILNIPPGRYTLIAEMVGYKKTVMKDVKVSSDLTTKVNIRMEPTVLQGEEVVVSAKRPIIERDITSKESIIDAEMVKDSPITEISDMLTLQSNVVDIPRTVEGTSVGIPYYTDLGIPQVHIRGGRVSETQYMIDGMPVSNPMYGELGLRMNKESVQEMQILAGSFNAEYGNAMSGMVNIVTKEGTQDWDAEVDYKTTKIGTESDRLWDLQNLVLSLSGPVFGATFFSTFRIKESANAVWEFDNITYDPEHPDKTYLGYGKPRYVHPYDTKASWQPWGFDDTKDLLFKLTIPLATTMKLNLSGSGMVWHTKNYNFWWQYNQDSRNENLHKTLNLSIILNHTLSNNTFYTLGISRFYKSRQQRVYRWINGEKTELIPAPLDPSEVDSSLMDYYYRSSEPSDPYYSEFKIGDDEYWTDEFQTTYNLKFDLSSQLSYRHLIKTGIDVRYFDLDVNEQNQVHLGGGHYTNIYKKSPIQIAFYIQDKMEYDYLILNAGLRIDYEKSEGSFWEEPTEWKSKEKEAEPYWRIAPRIGAAVPVTEATIFHFNYGIFYQHAAYANRFRNPDRARALTAIWPILGNPLLEPEETTAYEIGLKQRLGQDMLFEVNLWLKKTSNMVGTVWVPQFTDKTHTNPQYGVFANLDYSSARGIDLTLKKRYSNYVGFELNYSYSLATGIREDQFQGYRSRHTPALMPAQERILNWNQPHVIRFNLYLRYPPDMGNKILRNMRFNLLYSGNSGFPYTPTTLYEEPIGPINSRQRPFQHYIDARLIKTFRFSSFSVSPYIEVDNLLDTKNIVFSYTTTGSTTDPGDIYEGTTTYRDRPWYYGRRRQIRLGLNIKFSTR